MVAFWKINAYIDFWFFILYNQQNKTLLLIPNFIIKKQRDSTGIKALTVCTAKPGSILCISYVPWANRNEPWASPVIDHNQTKMLEFSTTGL